MANLINISTEIVIMTENQIISLMIVTGNYLLGLKGPIRLFVLWKEKFFKIYVNYNRTFAISFKNIMVVRWQVFYVPLIKTRNEN